MNTLLVRQPIFDDHERIAGYEILCRQTLRVNGNGAEQDCDTDRVVVDAFLGVGLPQLSAGHLAYMSVSREMLLGNAIQLLDPTCIVVQVRVGDHPDEVFLSACERLARAGYQIALEHFRLSRETEPLLRVADIVKLDVRGRPRETLAEEARQIRRWSVRLLAEKVENRREHEACLELGFELFQGYLFSRPETVSRRDLSVEHLRTLRLMTLVRDESVSDHAIVEAFRADAALSYKLLRIVNASAVGGKDLTSIGHAVGLLGRDALYRWLALLLITPQGRGGVAAEIAHATLTRARFCELLAERGRARLNAGTLFMIGMLSALDTFYQLPVGEIVEQLRLAPDASAALVGQVGPLGSALALVMAFEEGQWTELETLSTAVGVPTAELTNVYLEALSWAHERVQVFNFSR
jgi:EAL and modified HD-GYP domain-containing signal transduction protein